MQRKHTVWMSVVLSLIAASFASAAEMTGKQIMETQKERHKVKTEIGAENMLLMDKDGGKENRQLKRYAKEVEKDLHRYLVVFLSPGDIRGTALRTWENKSGENDQWLYLPASKKEQRIAKSSKKNYFMGTDLTYEDMEPEDLDNFTYNLLRTENFSADGKAQSCYVVEAIPANDAKKQESGYSKRIMWIENVNLTTLKTEFYDRRDKLQKVQTNHEFANVGGTVWRPKKSLMDNKEKNHKTVTSTTAREINTALDSSTFTERFITSGKHLD
ncbi:MAG: outer membrane lipoprotein-sorting protein [Deltaproteobacteria bacterium]|nr:outer membrane lipoprotein-sorting protein [Deltaproteobacteria bacterium]